MKRVTETLKKWEDGDFDEKDAALELFSLPQKELVDTLLILFTNRDTKKSISKFINLNFKKWN